MKVERKLDRVLSGVCEYYDIDKELVKSKSRLRELVIPRQVFSYIAYNSCRSNEPTWYKYEDVSYPSIARVLNKNTHATVLHGVRKVGFYVNLGDKELINDIESIADTCLNKEERAKLVEAMNTDDNIKIERFR